MKSFCKLCARRERSLGQVASDKRLRDTFRFFHRSARQLVLLFKRLGTSQSSTGCVFSAGWLTRAAIIKITSRRLWQESWPPLRKWKWDSVTEVFVPDVRNSCSSKAWLWWPLTVSSLCCAGKTCLIVLLSCVTLHCGISSYFFFFQWFSAEGPAVVFSFSTYLKIVMQSETTILQNSFLKSQCETFNDCI